MARYWEGVDEPGPYDWFKKESSRYILHAYNYEMAEKKMLKSFLGSSSKMSQTFKGTRTVWYCGDGRMIKVKDLDTPHLANIIEYLRMRAREALKIENPYFFGTNITSQIHGWLHENCITYPALVEEAKTRDIWNDDKIYIGPKQTISYVKHDKKLNTDQKVNLLIKLVEELVNK